MYNILKVCLKSSSCMHLNTVSLWLMFLVGFPLDTCHPDYLDNTLEFYFEDHIVCSMFHVSMYKRKHTEEKSVCHITTISTVLKSGNMLTKESRVIHRTTYYFI